MKLLNEVLHQICLQLAQVLELIAFLLNLRILGLRVGEPQQLLRLVEQENSLFAQLVAPREHPAALGLHLLEYLLNHFVLVNESLWSEAALVEVLADEGPALPVIQRVLVQLPELLAAPAHVLPLELDSKPVNVLRLALRKRPRLELLRDEGPLNPVVLGVCDGRLEQSLLVLFCPHLSCHRMWRKTN